MPIFTEHQLQTMVNGAILILPNRKILAVFLQGIFLHILSIRSLLAKFFFQIFEIFWSFEKKIKVKNFRSFPKKYISPCFKRF